MLTRNIRAHAKSGHELAGTEISRTRRVIGVDQISGAITNASIAGGGAIAGIFIST